MGMWDGGIGWGLESSTLFTYATTVFKGWPLPCGDLRPRPGSAGARPWMLCIPGGQCPFPAPFGGSWVPPLAVGGGSCAFIAGFRRMAPSVPRFRRFLAAASLLCLACEGGLLSALMEQNKKTMERVSIRRFEFPRESTSQRDSTASHSRFERKIWVARTITE